MHARRRHASTRVIFSCLPLAPPRQYSLVLGARIAGAWLQDATRKGWAEMSVFLGGGRGVVGVGAGRILRDAGTDVETRRREWSSRRLPSDWSGIGSHSFKQSSAVLGTRFRALQTFAIDAGPRHCDPIVADNTSCFPSPRRTRYVQNKVGRSQRDSSISSSIASLLAVTDTHYVHRSLSAYICARCVNLSAIRENAARDGRFLASSSRGW